MGPIAFSFSFLFREYFPSLLLIAVGYSLSMNWLATLLSASLILVFRKKDQIKEAEQEQIDGEVYEKTQFEDESAEISDEESLFELQLQSDFFVLEQEEENLIEIDLTIGSVKPKRPK